MIININTTTEENIKGELLKVNRLNQSIIQTAKANSKRAYDIFWKNRDENITPQAICDYLGNEAYKLFQAHIAMEEWIYSQDSTHEKLSIPEGWSVNIHQDGTVTITKIEE